ncbi:hypothetical protein D3C86_1933910 [compost metagenome]
MIGIPEQVVNQSRVRRLTYHVGNDELQTVLLGSIEDTVVQCIFPVTEMFSQVCSCDLVRKYADRIADRVSRLRRVTVDGGERNGSSAGHRWVPHECLPTTM